MPTEPWPVGRVVVRRQFHTGDQLGRVWVGRVAADDEHGLWMWIADGSRYRDAAAADGRAFRDVPFGEWGGIPKTLAEREWTGYVLMFHPHAGEHSVWFFYDLDVRFQCWYVNLELAGARWDDGETAGIDTIDYDLDIVVAPDRSWRWKDEEEFVEHLAHPGVYWVDDEAAVRAEGMRLIELVEAGAFPFDGTRAGYRPDPLWTPITTLPPGWDRPRALAEGRVEEVR